MTVQFKKRNLLVLSNHVGVEDAETLLQWLHGKHAVRVELSGCTHIHPAILQVLLAAGVAVSAWPQDADLAAWLQTAFAPANFVGK